ncbi:potassium channel family protein [Amphibacillus sediminis]|uniref:potassium channel family protein n=1 Tax=Amphibacillus sediminis TaxID=360185 RepID=UPI001FE02E59|nr:potassium channel family protein [Amphibacillus sediminis]
MIIVSIMIIVGIIMSSLVQFFGGKSYQRGYFSYEIFYTLIVVYGIILFGFGLLYALLAINHEVLVLTDNQPVPEDFLGLLLKSIYFSGTTLLTIGYGDMTPIGIARPLSLIEALIGYLIPAAFFLRIVFFKHFPDREERYTDYL